MNSWLSSKLVDVKIDKRSRKKARGMATEASYLRLNFGFLGSNCCVVPAILHAFAKGVY